MKSKLKKMFQNGGFSNNKNISRHSNNNNKNALRGGSGASGEYDQQSIRVFLFFVIFTYFASKVFFSFFKFYPIKSSSEEISNFAQLIIFTGILFFMSHIPILNSDHSINFPFWIGTLIGLQLPYYSELLVPFIKRRNETLLILLRIFFVLLISGIVIFLTYINFNNYGNGNGNSTNGGNGSSSSISYFYVVFAIFFIILAIIVTRNPVKYFKSVCAFSDFGCCPDGFTPKKSTDDTCGQPAPPCAQPNALFGGCCPDGVTQKLNINGTNCPPIYQQTEGQNIQLNLSFMLWIILFLFSFQYESKILAFLHGGILGMFISSLSFYGMGFLLEKSDPLACNSVNDCNAKHVNDVTFMKQYNTDYNRGVLYTLYVCSLLLIISLLYIIIYK